MNAIVKQRTFKLTDEKRRAVFGAIKLLRDELTTELVTLDADDRKRMPKMGAKTVDQVSKTYSCVSANPQYRPSFIDIDEFGDELSAVGELRELLLPLRQLGDMVYDTMLLNGSEALNKSLVCYQSFKAAARIKSPGAVTIYNELSAYFAGRGSKSAKTPPAAVPPVEPNDDK